MSRSSLVERLERESKKGGGNEVEMVVVERGLHGFVECEYLLGRECDPLLTR